jgi:hypothetical protein
MPSNFDDTKRKLDEAATNVEREIKGVIQHLNDHVVPKLRTEGTQALRSIAQELQKLADKMDDSKKTASTQK